MSNPEAVKKWRKMTKQRMVAAFGGKCGICGYSKCLDAMNFHHLDPSKKDFEISKIRANAKSWDKIVVELRKCICICNRCHSEVHSGMVIIPENVNRFNNDYTKYQKFKKDEFDKCPMCDNEKWKYAKTCSYRCAAIKSRRVDWSTVDLERLLKTKSKLAIAEQLGITDTAVRKRAKKLGLL